MSRESGESIQLAGWKSALGSNLAAFSVFLAVFVASTVSGFATLPGGSSELGVGTEHVAACQSTPFSAAFDTGYDPRLGDYAVTAVRLSGLDTDLPVGCGGRQYQIALADDQGTMLSERTGTTPTSATAFGVDLTAAHVRASDVASVQLTITG